MKILLSAGHGGTDSGSIGSDKGKEKDRTLEISNLVATKLKEAGHEVTIKQEKNSNGNWVFKNRNGYDYALSIHFNAFNGSATGVECLYKNKDGKATELSKEVANVLELKNRGAKKRTDLYMLNIGFDNLLEVCFHDNSKDLDAYNKKKNEVVNIIAEVINGGKIKVPSTSNASNGKKIDVKYQVYCNGKWYNDIINYNNTNSMGYAGVMRKAISGFRGNTVGKENEVGNLIYRVHTKNGKWLGEIIDRQKDKSGDDFAGILGKPIDGIAIKSTVGTAKYRVHVKGGNWLGWITKYDVDDYHKGMAGAYGKEIDAIQIEII